MQRTDSTVYNMPQLLYLGEDILEKRLEKAVKKTFEAHPYLMTRLVTDENGYVYKRQEEGEPGIEVLCVQPEAFDEKSLVSPFKLDGGVLYWANKEEAGQLLCAAASGKTELSREEAL